MGEMAQDKMAHNSSSYKTDVRPISDMERTEIEMCKHQFLVPDFISPLSYCCIKCGLVLINNQDGSQTKMYSPALRRGTYSPEN